MLTICATFVAEAVLASLLALVSEYPLGKPKLDLFRAQNNSNDSPAIPVVSQDKDIGCGGCKDNANEKQTLHSECSGI